jgi:hypothetical protein
VTPLLAAGAGLGDRDEVTLEHSVAVVADRSRQGTAAANAADPRLAAGLTELGTVFRQPIPAGTQVSTFDGGA